MLRPFSDLKQLSLAARDGEIGRIKDLYFDDQTWAVRYLAVDTGTWLPGRKVLLGPQAFGLIDEDTKVIAIHLTKDQIEKSPSIDTDQPVSRQHEEEWHQYFGYAGYWPAPEAIAFGGAGPIAVPVPHGLDDARAQQRGDPQLRSSAEVVGYSILASDGEIGKVDDFFIDDETWRIRYLTISQGWWAGRKVAVSPEWIDRVSWKQATVHVALTREAIKDAPEWDNERFTRDYEQRLHDYYGRRGYWPVDD